MGKPSRATHLAGSIEVQTLLRVMASFGRAGFEVATTLVETGYNFRAASEILGVEQATLRQRVHRIQERVKGVLGPSFWVPVRRRAKRFSGVNDGDADEDFS